MTTTSAAKAVEAIAEVVVAVVVAEAAMLVAVARKVLLKASRSRKVTMPMATDLPVDHADPVEADRKVLRVLLVRSKSTMVKDSTTVAMSSVRDVVATIHVHQEFMTILAHQELMTTPALQETTMVNADQELKVFKKVARDVVVVAEAATVEAVAAMVAVVATKEVLDLTPETIEAVTNVVAVVAEEAREAPVVARHQLKNERSNSPRRLLAS